MPIINGVFSNRYDDSDDYEDYCGMESYPYVILRESEELPITPSEVPKEKMSFLKRVSAMIKFKFFKFQL